jgi:hypothetical protein
MPGLVPGIHVFFSDISIKDVDHRDKPGDDIFIVNRPPPAAG